MTVGFLSQVCGTLPSKYHNSFPKQPRLMRKLLQVLKTFSLLKKTMYYISILPQQIPAKTEKELEEFCRNREKIGGTENEYKDNLLSYA
jgi:hypothetical protein